MTPALLAMARKELLALLPMWSGCLSLVLGTLVVQDRTFLSLALLAYGLGSGALGAHAFGHEYAHRTLPHVLAQPVPRRQILVVKLGVAGLLAALLGVAGYATVLTREVGRGPASPAEIAAAVWLTAMTLAPALAMLCRGTLPGAIFAVSLPACAAVAGGIIGWWKFDPDDAAIDRFQVAFFWRSAVVLWVSGAVVSWRAFLSAEVIDGRGRELHLPQWLRGDGMAPRRRNPVWQLVAKELRIQQMLFAIAGIYLLVAAAILLRQYVNPAFSAEILLPLTFMYVALFALIAGALASAEERQLGTLPAQLLLPVPVRRQWMIKSLVVFAIALTFAVALPASVITLVGHGHVGRSSWYVLLLVVLVLASASLYVSSLATSGVRAVTACVPFLASGVLLLSWSGTVARAVVQGATVTPLWLMTREAEQNTFLAAAILAICFLALMLRFAHANHRYSDRSWRRIAGQVGYTAAFILVAATLVSVIAYLPG